MDFLAVPPSKPRLEQGIKSRERSVLEAWMKVFRLFLPNIFRLAVSQAYRFFNSQFTYLAEIDGLLLPLAFELLDCLWEVSSIYDRHRWCSILWETAITEKLRKPGDKGSAQFCGRMWYSQHKQLSITCCLGDHRPATEVQLEHQNSHFKDLLGQLNFYQVFPV